RLGTRRDPLRAGGLRGFGRARHPAVIGRAKRKCLPECDTLRAVAERSARNEKHPPDCAEGCEFYLPDFLPGTPGMGLPGVPMS
ncbi:hypothetical protein, partial [Pseudorhodobacter sp.]|uniref:hypothetical protein n=1 Tax=Pseudorhodobacter sp. TaxID=1934400 RepID=UPI002647D77C